MSRSWLRNLTVALWFLVCRSSSAEETRTQAADIKEQLRKDLVTAISAINTEDANCKKSIGAKYKNLADYRTKFATGQRYYSIALSQPPPVRVRASLDTTSGQHVELDWDPNQTMKLVRTVTIPSAIDLGSKEALGQDGWRVSFVADPLPYSNNKEGQTELLVAQFVGAPFFLERAISGPDNDDYVTYVQPVIELLDDKIRKCLGSIGKKRQGNTESGDTSPEFESLRSVTCALLASKKPDAVCPDDWQSRAPGGDLRRKPFPKEHRLDGSSVSQPTPDTDALAMRFVNAVQGNSNLIPVSFCRVASNSDPGCNDGPLSFNIQVEALPFPQLDSSIDQLATLDSSVGSTRSLSSGVSGVAVDVFSILAEIAFEKAKSKAFSLLSEKVTDFVCEQLRLPFGVADDLLSEEELRQEGLICNQEKQAVQRCTQDVVAQIECEQRIASDDSNHTKRQACRTTCASDKDKPGDHCRTAAMLAGACTFGRMDSAGKACSDPAAKANECSSPDRQFYQAVSRSMDNRLAKECLAEKKNLILCRQRDDEASAKKRPVLLAQTCQVVRNLRVQELATSGQTILTALSEDLASRTLNLVNNRMRSALHSAGPVKFSGVNALFGKSIVNALSLAVRHAAGHTPLSQRDVQLLFIDFTQTFKGAFQDLQCHDEKSHEWYDSSYFCENNPSDGRSVVAPGATSCIYMARAMAAGKSYVACPPLSFEPLAKTEAAKDCKGPVNRAGCAVQVAAAIVAQCSNSVGRCDAHSLTDMIRSPASFFSLGKSCEGLFTPYEGGLASDWKDVNQLITRGLDVVLPPKGTSPAQQLRTALDFIFDVATHLYSESVMGEAPSINAKLLAQMLPELRRLTHGIIDQDAQGSLLAGVKLVELASQQTFDTPEYESKWGWQSGTHPSVEREDMQRMLRKLTQVIAAVGSYTQNYSTDAHLDPKQAEARREARKKALESLITQSTERSNRQGDIIVSLGANVGFFGGGEYQVRPGEAAWTYPQLSLPMGVAIQKLPWGQDRAGGRRRERDVLGLHAQLSLIDLGQFLNFNKDSQLAEVNWTNFVTLGAQLGMLFPLTRRARSSELLNVVFDVHYAPGLNYQAGSATTTNQAGVFRFGLFLGYYVPFFDFN